MVRISHFVNEVQVTKFKKYNPGIPKPSDCFELPYDWLLSYESPIFLLIQTQLMQLLVGLLVGKL